MAAISMDREVLAAAPRLVVLTSDSAAPCGVEAFARRLAATAGQGGVAIASDAPTAEIDAALESADALVLNFPIVAWKRALLTPLAIALRARRRGLSVVVVLHEWADLDWKRRLSYAPVLLLADAVVFSCPSIRRQFARSGLSSVVTRRRSLLPIPPNLTRPATTAGGERHSRLLAEQVAGRLVIGQFGSIYPKKRTLDVLAVAAALRAKGEDPFVVFIGSFVRGQDRMERDFAARVRALGLQDRVLVTGFIDDDAELFGLLDAVQVFVYCFTEGLTARRASVYACLAAGRPVVVNGPRDPTAFDHHPSYRALLASGRLRLVACDASPSGFVDEVLAARDLPAADGIDVAPVWLAAVAAVQQAARPLRFSSSEVSLHAVGKQPNGPALGRAESPVP